MKTENEKSLKHFILFPKIKLQESRFNHFVPLSRNFDLIEKPIRRGQTKHLKESKCWHVHRPDNNCHSHGYVLVSQAKQSNTRDNPGAVFNRHQSTKIMHRSVDTDRRACRTKQSTAADYVVGLREWTAPLEARKIDMEESLSRQTCRPQTLQASTLS